MPAGPPRTDQTKGHEARVLDLLAGLGGGGRTGSPRGDGRYGLLLLVLIGTYLFSAFNGRHLTTEVQIGLFAVILLLAMRTSPLPGRWPLIISTATVAGSAAAFGAALTGTQVGEGSAELWKALVLLVTAIMVVRRVLAKPTGVTSVAGYLRMLTARETTRMATSREIASSAIIMSLAHGLMAETSVGLNAVAVLNERYR
jgi:hypothetical protein